MSTPRYSIEWRVNDILEAEDTMDSWLGVKLLQALAKFLSWFDNNRHKITVTKLP